MPNSPCRRRYQTRNGPDSPSNAIAPRGAAMGAIMGAIECANSTHTGEPGSHTAFPSQHGMLRYGNDFR